MKTIIWILFAGIATQTALAGDEGYRFNLLTRRCENAKKEPGFNHNYRGECGNMIGDNLVGMDFRGMHLVGALFTSADLRNADFRDAVLSYADLRNANLTNADFSRANLNYANLGRAIISAAWFVSAQLNYANLESVGKSGGQARFYDAQLHHAALTKADLSYARLEGASFQHANLREADFEGATFGPNDNPTTDFRHANLHSAKMRGTSFNYWWITGGRNLVSLESARFDVKTELPINRIEAEERGMKFVPEPKSSIVLE